MPTPARRARLLTACLAAAVTLPFTGCATPFGSGDETTTRSATSTPSPSPTGSGRQLTEAEAEAALPTRPKGAEASGPAKKNTDRATDPKECIDVLRAGETGAALRKDRVATANRSWTTASPTMGHQFTVTSYSRPVGPELLDRAGAAMGGCDAFSLTGHDDDGFFDLRVLAEPLPVTSLGEQNFGVRMTSFQRVNGKSERFYLDFVIVRVGHNLIEVATTHQDEDVDVEPLEEAVQDIIDKLEDTP